MKSAWLGPVPLATEHAVMQWRERVAPGLTLAGAHAELHRFLVHAAVAAVPPYWVRTKPGASYLVCPTTPDVCIPVQNGYALTVLVRRMAWVTEAMSDRGHGDGRLMSQRPPMRRAA